MVPFPLAAAAALVGAVIIPLLVSVGLRQLRWNRPVTRWSWLLSVAVGILVMTGIASLAPGRIDRALLPAAAAWALALSALALCDARTMRIPTPLARQATVVVLFLLTAGAAIADTWETWAVGLAWSALSTGAFATAWRYAGAGRGDVRLALLGGLGLSFASLSGLVVGLVAWAAVVASQAVVVYARAGSREAQIPVAPGLVTGLLVAVLLPW